MSIFLDRRPRSRRFLIWKTRIFAVAAVIALVGMYMNNPYVTGTALVLLLIGVALRFVPERRPAPADDEHTEDPTHPEPTDPDAEPREPDGV